MKIQLFEYRILPIHDFEKQFLYAPPSGTEIRDGLKYAEARLTAMGEFGWELCATSHRVLIFKRKLCKKLVKK